jgi:lysozyme family protein
MIEDIIENIIKAEGGYTNNPLDTGGETMFGITIKVARANGYLGAMKDMPKAVAQKIYKDIYFVQPKFEAVYNVSPAIAEELTDTGVNMGTGFAKPLLQAALNLLDKQLLVEDGDIGAKTIEALKAFLNKRGKDGEVTLLKTLNVMQGAHYIDITKNRPANKEFFYGWMKNRVK